MQLNDAAASYVTGFQFFFFLDKNSHISWSILTNKLVILFLAQQPEFQVTISENKMQFFILMNCVYMNTAEGGGVGGEIFCHKLSDSN